ncbi:RNA polymerase sigma factor [Neobacillus niacini]|uniref:RNA polymerase sigma factor n=1 Tax=Neobacillus niacini TaxID=86668 RepID=UPI0021CAFBD4|nr:RNA polymerase sigma factor [Neobacillus niacini]MCM3766725.1 RNA polymerase sigma factor [Neobacillus niacini]
MGIQNNGYNINSPVEFTRFCEDVGPEAFRLALYWAGNRDEAEDIVQEAFLRTWKSGKDVRVNLKGWFFRILWHVFLDKRKTASQETLQDLEWKSSDVHSSYQKVDDRGEIDWLLQTVAEDDRHLLAMHYSADLTFRQMAEITGMREGTIKSRIHRTLKSIRKRLPKEYKHHFGKERTKHES